MRRSERSRPDVRCRSVRSLCVTIGTLASLPCGNRVSDIGHSCQPTSPAVCVGGLSQTALASSASNIGLQSLTDTSIGGAVVDNVGFTYRLQTFSISANTRLLDASILYTLP